MRKPGTRSIIFYALMLVVLYFCFSWMMRNSTETGITYSDMVQLFQQEKVSSFTYSDNQVDMTLYDEWNGQTEVFCQVTDLDIFREDLGGLIAEQWASGVLVQYSYEPDSSTPWYVTWGPTLLTVVMVIVLFYFMFIRQQQGTGGQGSINSFGRARITPAPSTPVTFADVAGADEEKEELQEIVEFLRDPQRFSRLGARIPKGVLLVGPPGTGKTLLARAVAGEAGVEFLSISGSDFVELYVGVGASRVRSLFEQAKKVAPSIVFIDEIDAVGRQRGAGLGGGHDEREQTLNQLLVEMDGFAGNSGVVVLAATNRQDILDPALLRPGRFDRQVYVGLPDIRGRQEILRIHAKDKPLAEDVNLQTLARATGGFTGADLENLMNEGALLAARRKCPAITMEDLHEAMIKVIAGPEKRSQVVTEQARRLTAYHEAGHAVVIRSLPSHDPVHQISIVPRGRTGGMTISLPTEDKSFRSRTELYEDIVAALGGRAAEELVLGDVSTGASNDIQQATRVARAMVTRYGMSSKLGMVLYDSDNDEVFIGRSMGHTQHCSEAVAAEIDAEVKALIDQAYGQCRRVLTQELEHLHQVAAFLLEHEVMTAEEFEAVFTGEAPEQLTML